MSNKHYLDASKVKNINTENTAVPTSNCTCNVTSPSSGGGCKVGMYIFILIIILLSIAGGFYMINKNKI